MRQRLLGVVGSMMGLALLLGLAGCGAEDGETREGDTAAGTPPESVAPVEGALAAYNQAREGALPERLATLPLEKKMGEVDEAFYDLGEAVKVDDWQVASDRLAALVHLFRSAREAREEERFKEFADAMLEQLRTAAEVLGSADLEEITNTLDSVQGQCKACHEVYKKKE
ncbi:MAG: cytochrome c [Planctomycetota bacterium]